MESTVWKLALLKQRVNKWRVKELEKGKNANIVLQSRMLRLTLGLNVFFKNMMALKNQLLEPRQLYSEGEHHGNISNLVFS